MVFAEAAGLSFVAASALHAGFQLSVTVIVYPALSEVGVGQWPVAHARHSRRIAPVVAIVYAALVGSGTWLSATGPTGWWWVSLGCGAGAVVVTAGLAAPLHTRLDSPHPVLLRRLLLVDRARCVLAVGGLLTALVAAHR